MAAKNRVNNITLTSIDSATFTGALQVINTNGLDESCFLIRIINNSDKDITISYDGLIDHDFVGTLSTLQLPAQSNAQPSSFISNISKGTKVYVKGAAGTGLVYLAGYYQN